MQHRGGQMDFESLFAPLPSLTRSEQSTLLTPSTKEIEDERSTSLNSSGAEDHDMKTFLGQFDTVIQAYTRYLSESDNRSVQSKESHTLQCDACSHSVTPNDRFCSGCGMSLTSRTMTPQRSSCYGTPRTAEKDVSKELQHVAAQVLMKLSSAQVQSQTYKQRQEVVNRQRQHESRRQTEKQLQTVIYQQQQIQFQQQEQLRKLQEQQELIQRKLDEFSNGRVQTSCEPPRSQIYSEHTTPSQHASVSMEAEAEEPTVLLQHPVTNQANMGPFNLDLVRYLMKEQQDLKQAAQQTEEEKRRVEEEKSALRQNMQKLSSLNESGLSSASGRSRSAPNKKKRVEERQERSVLNRSRSTNRSLREPSLSTIGSTPTRRSVSEKDRIREKNMNDSSLLAGFFLPNDLRGCATFARERRFLSPTGFRDPHAPFYFLEDSIEQDIKATRGGRSPMRNSTSSRGYLHTNVTSKWGSSSLAGGGISPGPGTYDPKWSKSLPYSPR